MVDADGAVADLRELVVHDGQHVAVIDLATGARVMLPAHLLHLVPEGGYAIEGRWSQFSSESPSGVAVPLVQERATVSVRASQQRVRIRRRVVTDHHEVQTPVWTERVQIERVDRGTFVDRAPEPRQEGDTLVIPVVEEVPVVVVEKRLRLREELRVRIVRERRVEGTIVALRRHELDIEPEPITEPGPESPETADDNRSTRTREV